MTKSFLMLARKTFGHHFWTEHRVFSRAEAWLDLLQTAAYAPHKRMIAGHSMEIPRGGLVASVRWLSDRYRWSNTKVCLFLDVLEGEGMITRQKRHGNTLLTICKYDVYNQCHDAKATERRPESDKEATAGRQRDDEIEEGKEGRELLREPGREIPSLDRIQTHARTIGLAPWKAEDWWCEMEACGWLDHQSRPVAKWQPLMARVKSKWEADGRPAGPPSNGGNGKKPSKPCEWSWTTPIYDDQERMVQDAHGNTLDPETGKIIKPSSRP